MTFSKKYLVWVGIIIFVTAITASGLAFYHHIVGPYSTNVWSVLFGWQWVYLAVISVVALGIAGIRKNKFLGRAAAIIIGSLAIVLCTAQFVYSSRLYITGEGGPAGPVMNCLGWEDSFTSGVYDSNTFNLCLLMSIPSFNKFVFDQRYGADSSDSSATYYAALVTSELIVLSGTALGIRRLRN